MTSSRRKKNQSWDDVACCNSRRAAMSEALTLSSLPLYPLGTVLYPGGLLPLQIFEVRYLDMIGKCAVWRRVADRRLGSSQAR